MTGFLLMAKRQIGFKIDNFLKNGLNPVFKPFFH